MRTEALFLPWGSATHWQALSWRNPWGMESPSTSLLWVAQEPPESSLGVSPFARNLRKWEIEVIVFPLRIDVSVQSRCGG